MQCYKCNSELNLPNNKIGFRQTCPNCLVDLHVCKNCRHYMVGKPNDCNVPNTEFVSDREKNNFCEDFEIKVFSKEEKKSKKDISKKLFKDSEDDNGEKKDFNSLFKD